MFSQEGRELTTIKIPLSIAQYLNPSTALTIVGAALTLAGLAIGIYKAIGAKKRAKKEAKRLQRYYYIEAARDLLKSIGYKWTEEDLTNDDLYNLQVSVNQTVETNSKDPVVSWFLSHGLNPKRVFIDVAEIPPERTSRMERFLEICETMKGVGYVPEHVDLIDYPSTVQLFSDFYRLLNEWVTDKEEIVSIVYRMVYWMDLNLFDPYRLMPSLEDLRKIRALRTSVPIYVPEALGPTYIGPVTEKPTAVPGTVPQIFVPEALGPTWLGNLLPEPQSVNPQQITLKMTYEEAIKRYPEISEKISQKAEEVTETELEAGFSPFAIVLIAGLGLAFLLGKKEREGKGKWHS